MLENGRTGKTVALQLRDQIRALIMETGVRPGGKIPTEAEIKETFGGSRPTIREALKLLEQDGLIRVEHGRGRYLTAAGSLHVDRPITKFESITQMAGHYGYALENKLLSIQEEKPQRDIMRLLGLEAGQTIIRLERLRLHEREPVVYCLDFVRRDVVSDRIFDVDWSGSLLDVLEGYGARPRMSSAMVRAELLPQDVIERHDLRDFGPALVIEETTFTDSGLSVSHAVDFHKGSHFAFSLLRK
ncbi:GntR family transcriptional regulator [Mesorhizobium sp. NZP2298]|uniref:GntR family transcriptional regulator n=1 Tax=Mesorhizobium sp. NZP2298 TaxID=2483403 RepID=UPI00155577CC|nr:GntR family transcriptional regulator [Mesorhizobium sp. NZP2298]QKC98224.1 GntR family transcriptional regulator [Mesorhizobium sp. NZP2298]